MPSLRQLTQEDAINLLESHDSFQSILHSLGLRPAGGNYKALHARFSELGIDTSSIYEKSKAIKVRRLTENHDKGRIDPSLVLIESSPYSRSVVRRILRQEKLLTYSCESCGLSDTWNGAPLTLQIDHRNGIANDHRLENLRFLCPNCHSQTESFAGRNTRKPKKTCTICSREIKGQGGRNLCLRCAAKARRKVLRPSETDLRAVISLYNNNLCAVGRHYGVSDNAIRKWLVQFSSNDGE